MDVLNMDYINSLPQPFLVRLVGDKDFRYEVEDFDVESGLFRMDVCGLLQVSSMSDAYEFKDAAGGIHDAAEFFIEDTTK